MDFFNRTVKMGALALGLTLACIVGASAEGLNDIAAIELVQETVFSRALRFQGDAVSTTRDGKTIRQTAFLRGKRFEHVVPATGSAQGSGTLIESRYSYQRGYPSGGTCGNSGASCGTRIWGDTSSSNKNDATINIIYHQADSSGGQSGSGMYLYTDPSCSGYNSAPM